MTQYLKTLRILFVQSLIIVSNFALLGIIFQPCISVLPFTQQFGRCEEGVSEKCNSNSTTCEIEDEFTTTYNFTKLLLSTKKPLPIIGRFKEGSLILDLLRASPIKHRLVAITNTYKLKDYTGIILKLE